MIILTRDSGGYSLTAVFICNVKCFWGWADLRRCFHRRLWYGRPCQSGTARGGSPERGEARAAPFPCRHNRFCSGRGLVVPWYDQRRTNTCHTHRSVEDWNEDAFNSDVLYGLIVLTSFPAGPNVCVFLPITREDSQVMLMLRSLPDKSDTGVSSEFT